MYNQETEELINAAIRDGRITKKEIDALWLKNLGSGMSQDEAEMVLRERLAQKKSFKRNLRIGLLVSATVLVVLWLIFSPKVEKAVGDFNKKSKIDEKIKISKTIKAGEYEQAEEMIAALSKKEDIIHFKSEIQLDSLSKKIASLEIWAEKKKYRILKLELKKLHWQRIDNNYYPSEITCFDSFTAKKKALNLKMPAQYRLKAKEIY
jgi:hypothetical protein